MPPKNTDLQEIPGFSQGIRRNSAARMVKLAQPICPHSKIKMIRTPEGRYVPDPTPNPVQNCQAEKGQDQETALGWEKKCEERGHDPYFTTKIWYSEEDVVDEETGEVIRTIRKQHKERRPNIAQVPSYPRVNGSDGARYKIRKFGFKRLQDIGYAEVCQFRNCQNTVRVKSRYGLYCGPEHATLIAADTMGLTLQQIPGGIQWDLGSETGIRMKQVQQLAEAQNFADVKPV